MGLKLCRRLKRAALLMAAGLCMFPMYSLAETESSIEQVYVNMPEITVYGQGLGTEASAFLGEKQLTADSQMIFSESGEATYYYVLLDISNSMPEEYFEQIKSAVCNFEQTLDENDRMILYTFGEEVKLVLDETHNRADTEAALAGVDNTDNRTLLFAAVSQAADRADQVPAESCKRRILMVISDGEDFTIGKTSSAEAQENLKKKGIPVYAFGIQDTKREYLNDFGAFARMSGGEITVFGNQEAGSFLDGFHQQMESFQVLKFQADTNKATNQMMPVVLTMADNRSLTKEVPIIRHIPDQTAPVLIRAEKISDNQLEVEFSEQVSGAETASNYLVNQVEASENDGESETRKTGTVAVDSVSCDPGSNLIYTLTFENELEPGDYEISCVGITDLSMEANAVSNCIPFLVEQRSWGERLAAGIQQWYWIGLIAAAAVLSVIIFRFYRKVKKGSGVVYVDETPVLASDVEVHKHVAIREQEGVEFFLTVQVKKGAPETMKLRMQGSFIVGRSKICNLYFDDQQMSRQHFALEWKNDDMYVTDLQTTNGTKVNGMPIHQQYRLQKNDKISAGSVDMRIRW